ncbi:hypothetical protein ABZP36_024220 [Zizania latifolia]
MTRKVWCHDKASIDNSLKILCPCDYQPMLLLTNATQKKKNGVLRRQETDECYHFSRIMVEQTPHLSVFKMTVHGQKERRFTITGVGGKKRNSESTVPQSEMSGQLHANPTVKQTAIPAKDYYFVRRKEETRKESNKAART